MCVCVCVCLYLCAYMCLSVSECECLCICVFVCVCWSFKAAAAHVDLFTFVRADQGILIHIYPVIRTNDCTLCQSIISFLIFDIMIAIACLITLISYGIINVLLLETSN